MKKFLQFSVAAAIVALVACGPSAEEKAKEQAKLDSIKADSIKKVQEDSIKSAADKAKADSTAKADSAAKAVKK